MFFQLPSAIEVTAVEDDFLIHSRGDQIKESSSMAGTAGMQVFGVFGRYFNGWINDPATRSMGATGLEPVTPAT